MKYALAAAILAISCGTSGLALAQSQTFKVGDKVELEASKHWVPCTVTEPGPELVRAFCTEYPALSRGARVYMARNDPSAIRKTTGKTGPAPVAAAAKPAAAAAAGGILGLKVGEYACYGSGGRPMIGLGFKVLAGNRYTDLDGKNPGTIATSGGNVTFRGGHMAGTAGRELKNGKFRIGTQASCEPW